MLLKGYVPIFCIISLLLGCGSSSTDDNSTSSDEENQVVEEAPNELNGT